MKTSPAILLAALLIPAAACNNNKNTDASADSTVAVTDVSQGKTKIIPGKYVSLETGQPVYIVEDTVTGYAVDTLTKLPVLYYIDTQGDTLNNVGEPVVGLVRTDEGKWTISDSAKIKVDGDKVKIKDGDTKIKIDGDETKVKSGDYKKKTDGDESKEKDGTTKIKKDGDKIKVKPDNR